MFINVHNDSGNHLDRNVRNIELYPTGSIKDGYIEININALGEIKIVITKELQDKVVVKGYYKIP